MKVEFSILTELTKRLFYKIVDQGYSPQKLEEITGIRRKQLDIFDQRFSISKYYKLLEAGITWSDQDDFIFSFARELDIKALGLAGYIITSSTTIKEGLWHLARYFQIVSNNVRCQIEETEEDQVKITFKVINESEYNQQLLEIYQVLIVKLVRELSGKDSLPVKIVSSYSKPKYISKLQRFFSESIIFDKEDNSITFESFDLEEPLPACDHYSQHLYIQHARNLMVTLVPDTPFSRKVEGEILKNLPTGQVDIEMVSENFGMSRWTLFRKLKDEGTSFRNIYDDVRRNLATSYIQLNEFSINEITSLLGFSSLIAFNQAFKRWTGISPKHYREKIKGIGRYFFNE